MKYAGPIASYALCGVVLFVVPGVLEWVPSILALAIALWAAWVWWGPV